MKQIKKALAYCLLATCLTASLVACSAKESVNTDQVNLVSVQGDFTDFTADTMSGKSFSQEDLADYDLTVVNIWATTCGYCIEEMEGLEKFYEGLPENVNFVTICVDAAYDMDTAQAILTKKEASYETLIGNKSLNDAILMNIQGTPTTVFLDSKGNLVGDSIVGAPCVEDMDRAAKLYQAVTDQHLEELGS